MTMVGVAFLMVGAIGLLIGLAYYIHDRRPWHRKK